MIFEMIDFLTSLIATIIVGLILFWVLLLILKINYKKKGERKMVKQIEELESKFKRKVKSIGKEVWGLFLIVITMILCVILAIAVKPIIYKLNFPLGEGYATFASYIVAICLWMMLRKN